MTANICRLESEGLIHLHGEKIGEFLQGQLSCDTRRLTPERSVPGALCNVKGRVVSDLRVIRIDDKHCLLRLRRSVAEAAAQTLRKYAMFSRIEVLLETNPHIEGLYSAVAGQNLDMGDTPLPARKNGVARLQNSLLVRTAGDSLELVHLDDKRLSLPGSTLEPGREEDFRARALAAGDYAIEIGDSEVFTPQQLNYDRSDRVSFDKGCYTGQEVIARLHYKGKSKRRLRIMHLAARDTGPPRDTPIFNGDNGEVGSVLRCESADDGSLLIAALVLAGEPDATLLLSSGDQLTPCAAEEPG